MQTSEAERGWFAQEMPRKPRVLTFVHYYLPGYRSGGPVRTISNLVERLGDEFDFWIVTTDRDALDERPYSGVRVNEWNEVGKAHVYYASPEKQRLSNVVRLMRSTDHDIVYLNSFFAPVSTILPLVVRLLRLAPRKPLVIAPRGEFSLGALGLKRFKKRTYMFLARLMGLYLRTIWQASSEHEAADIRRTLGLKRDRILMVPPLSAHGSQSRRSEPRQNHMKHIVLAPDLPMAPVEVSHARERQAGAPLRVVFLSRISPMKNLDYALRVLASVPVPVEFHIVGPVFDERYWRGCLSLIERLPGNVIVDYHGDVPSHEVSGVLSSHDLFFLPTKGENYGHVIYEALAAGLPVLISDTTPWRNLEEHGIGWDLSIDQPDRFSEVIETLFREDGAKCAERRRRAREYAAGVAGNDEAVAANRALFTAVLHGDGRVPGTGNMP